MADQQAIELSVPASMVQQIEQSIPGMELPDLGRLVRTGVQANEQSRRITGLALLEAKARTDHGSWLSWLRDHAQLSDRQARRYMAYAQGKLMALSGKRTQGKRTPASRFQARPLTSVSEDNPTEFDWDGFLVLFEEAMRVDEPRLRLWLRQRFAKPPAPGEGMRGRPLTKDEQIKGHNTH